MGNEFMAVGAYVDDSAKIRTRKEEGTKRHQELSTGLVEAGFTVKENELDDHPEGIDFAGRVIEIILNIYGTGLALTQPSMHTKIGESLQTMGADRTTDMVWLPISKT